MDTFKLLDELEELIQNCKHIPMTGKILIGEELLLQFIDRIRSQLPEEIRQAKLVVKDQERLLENTHEEAERILTEVNQRISSMARDSEVVRQAQATAEEIVSQGRRVAWEIKNNATLYADEIMHTLEKSLEQNLLIVRGGREELNQMKKVSG